MKAITLWSGLAVLAFFSSALAQDSGSKDPAACTVGDAVSPWDDGSAPLGSEQCNDYIVDLVPFQSAWGDGFAVAPLIKSSKTASGFTGSLISAQAVSKDYLTAQPFVSSTYDLWSAPGFGVNNDITKNDAGTPVITTGMQGDQFAAAFAEFSTTDLAASYNSIIGALVNREPSDPLRLYVHRVVAAANSCDDNSNLSQMGFGAVDANGNLVFRSDDFALTGGCALANITEDNILGADMAARDCDARNVVSNTYPGGAGADPPAASMYVDSSTTSHNTPSMIPASANAGAPAYIGSNFGVTPLPGHYIHGQAGSVVDSGAAHLAAGVLDHRGNVSYTTSTFFGAGTGTAALLSRVNADCGGPGNLQCTDSISVWGLGADGAIVGTPRVLTLPRTGPNVVITDACDGTGNILGKNEFGNYRSQAAFRGGNGQVALGVDQDGRLLVAAMANHPTDTTTSDWPINYIAVARIDTPADATVEWTMAAYNDGTVGIPGGTGKAILDGPGGNVIGRLVTLDNVTGGAPLGPSMSSPMMDSVGNLYFISAIEILNTNGSTNFNSGVIRAVYDPDTFCYELDLLMTLGGTPNFGPMFYDPLAVHGANSDLNWTVNFMGVADSNSIDSGTAFSGNISASAHLGMDPAQITDTRDVRAMGGMVLSVEIVYDSDQDGDLDECSNPFTPPSDDETYNVLLYLSANPAAGPTCPPVENCGDQDDNGIRDDACAWYECNAGVCGTVNKTTQADIGGANGACPTDTACDGNDRFHALNCFQNKNTLGVPPYPCEASTPLALNVDAGGPSTCVLDGVCDGNDAFHALNCFENDWFDGTPNYQCDCGPQPTPPSGPLARAGQAQLTLRAPDKAQPGDVVSVDVHLGSAVDALRGYQLHLGTAGGDSGELELVDISVNTKRRDYAFAGAPGTWNAFNVSSGQMVVGMDAPLGVPARAGSYLATFTYRVPKNAEGAFIFEVRYDGNSVIPQDRTFLFGPHAGLMNVTVPPAARMDVVGRHGLDKRLGARD